jgi:hypothetical protein
VFLRTRHFLAVASIVVTVFVTTLAATSLQAATPASDADVVLKQVSEAVPQLVIDARATLELLNLSKSEVLDDLSHGLVGMDELDGTPPVPQQYLGYPDRL